MRTFKERKETLIEAIKNPFSENFEKIRQDTYKIEQMCNLACDLFHLVSSDKATPNTDGNTQTVEATGIMVVPYCSLVKNPL